MDTEKKMISVLESNNHSLFILNYRLIMAVKDRHVIINEEIADRLKEIFICIGQNNNITLKQWVSKEDYIDVMFGAHPNSELSKFINAYKSAGSRLIKKDFPDIQERMENRQFWSKSFCLLTVGDVTEDIIMTYLDKQSPKLNKRN